MKKYRIGIILLILLLAIVPFNGLPPAFDAPVYVVGSENTSGGSVNSTGESDGFGLDNSYSQQSSGTGYSTDENTSDGSGEHPGATGGGDTSGSESFGGGVGSGDSAAGSDDGSTYGGNNPGGSNPGGNNPGGSNPGGSNPGGSNPGGSNPGGSNPGGSNPGGSNPGGSNPGGSNPGGSNPGGSNPGGSNPGGNNPGGNNPGGDIDGDTDNQRQLDPENLPDPDPPVVSLPEVFGPEEEGSPFSVTDAPHEETRPIPNPEPTTIFLLGAGAAGLALLRRRAGRR